MTALTKAVEAAARRARTIHEEDTSGSHKLVAVQIPAEQWIAVISALGTPADRIFAVLEDGAWHQAAELGVGIEDIQRHLAVLRRKGCQIEARAGAETFAYRLRRAAA